MSITLNGAPYTAYRGAQTSIPIGGTSVIALYGPLYGGIIINPSTVQEQGISPLLTYVEQEVSYYEGPPNTWPANSITPNGANKETRNVIFAQLGPPEPLYISLVGPAGLVENNGTEVIYPGQSYTVPQNCQTNVYVNAATSGHRFTAIAIQPATQYPPTAPAPVSFPPTGPTGLTKALRSYLYQEYQGDDDLQAFVESYNSIAQAYVDWFNNLNLPIYTQLSGGLLDWVGQGLYGYARPTLYSETANLVGPPNTFSPNQSGPNFVTIVNDITNVAVTSDDVYQRCITWHFYKGDGKYVDVLWLKRRVYRFLFGVNGTDAEGPTDQISVIIGTSTISITIVTEVMELVSGAIPNGFQLNSITPNGALAQPTFSYPVPQVANQLVEAISIGALETPYQFTTTCRIGAIGMKN